MRLDAPLGGESALIERMACKAKQLPPPQSLTVACDIGDDTAVLGVGDRTLLWTVDMLVEGIHFRLDWIDAHALGWKALAVNLSDIAAMGGVPAGALLSIALPSERAGEWLDTFVEGFLECARRHHTALVGGDTNRAAQVVIDVSVLGFLEGRAVPRGGAQVGDWILVTGALGGSRAGLEALMRGEVEGVDLTPHFRPQPRLQVGALARAQGATAMMDLSDGLAADLPKLLRASGVGAVVYAHRLPVHPVALQWATAHGSDPALFALAGGEDYELLITAPPSTAQRMLDEIPNATGVALTPIGAVTAERTLWLEYPDGVRVEFPAEGWDHFRG